MDFSVSYVPEGYEFKDSRAIESFLVQAAYESSDGSRILIRKAFGTEDISGDYEEYTDAQAADADGRKVTLRGNGGKIYVSVWKDGGYTYSVSTNHGLGKETVLSIIKGVE